MSKQDKRRALVSDAERARLLLRLESQRYMYRKVSSNPLMWANTLRALERAIAEPEAALAASTPKTKKGGQHER
jgi:hypothetical protein